MAEVAGTTVRDSASVNQVQLGFPFPLSHGIIITYGYQHRADTVK